MTTGTQSLDRAAELLTLVVRSETAIPYATLVDQTDLPRSTASRLLQGLERNGLLERDEHGSFRGGALFAHYVSRFDRVEALVSTAKPVLERVASATGETVNLAVVRGQSVVHVAQIDSTFILGATSWVGLEVPSHTSALGKVMYAFDLLARPTGVMDRLTASTITDPQVLERELTEVRRTGFAVTRSELEVGLDGVAAPVRGADGPIVAALGVSGPAFRIDESVNEFGALLIAESAQLTNLLSTKKEVQQ